MKFIAQGIRNHDMKLGIDLDLDFDLDPITLI